MTKNDFEQNKSLLAELGYRILILHLADFTKKQQNMRSLKSHCGKVHKTCPWSQNQHVYRGGAAAHSSF